MKHIISLAIALVLGISTLSAQSKLDAWSELKAFHGVMSQTFHPAEEGNLTPIKTRIDEMCTLANTLNKSKAPAEFPNKKEVKSATKRLAKGSKALKKLIAAKASDEEIVKNLSGLHDVFHEIVGLCSGEHHD